MSAASNWDHTSFKADVGLGGAALGDMHMCFRAELAKIQCVEQHRHEGEVGIGHLWQTVAVLVLLLQDSVPCMLLHTSIWQTRFLWPIDAIVAFVAKGLVLILFMLGKKM